MDSKTYYAAWHVVYIIIIVPTVLGNGLLIISIIKNRKLRSNMHVLIGNLAVSDLIVGTILIPTDMAADVYNLKRHKYFCLGIITTFSLSLGSSCYNLLLISIERYIAIAHPLRTKLLLTKSMMIFMISLGWIINAINAGIPLSGVNTFTNSTTECWVEKVWTKANLVSSNWQMIVALLINISCYAIVVFIALRKSRQETNVIGDGLNINRQARKNLYQLITMVIVLGTFILCWLPYVVMAVITTFWDTPFHHYIKRCTLIPGLLNSSVNWLIYGYRNMEFRRSFAALIRCRCSFGSRRESDTVNTNS